MPKWVSVQAGKLSRQLSVSVLQPDARHLPGEPTIQKGETWHVDQ